MNQFIGANGPEPSIPESGIRLTETVDALKAAALKLGQAILAADIDALAVERKREEK